MGSPTNDLLVRIDPRAGIGLQEQIYASIRHAILNGVVAPGARVPSSRDLALDLGVSRTTSLLALDRLLAEGYLEARRGSGTFVARELPDDLPRPPRETPRSRSAHPPLSRRGEALAASQPGARRVGGPPRAFRIGTPAVDLFPVEVWTKLSGRRLRLITPSQLDYCEPAGFEALREAIAGHVAKARGTRCEPDQVFVTAGAQRALDVLCRLLLDPGDDAWMEEPGYPGAHNALVAAGARIHPVRVDSGGLDVRAGARRAPRARLVYVTPSHQFPLGAPMSLARRLALLRWASAAGAWVLEDDYDAEFRYGAPPIPCLHGLDADGRVIYLGTFSKTLFPSLRLGFMIVPLDLRERFLAVRRGTEANPPMLEQMVLADFMREGSFERHLRRLRVAYRERLEALAEAVRRRCGGALRLHSTRTGLHAVADLEGADARRVFEEAAARGVEVMPLSAYYYGRGAQRNALVLGFGSVRPDAIEDGMRRLASAIEAARAG
ncbi:MAG TPA: PLP-dependent aminotransferase family protein [Vicinamibacteria bacterium]|nr:PLP-dependent aminotransferase family protein [Vicinamibacteria bacterium]